MVISNKPEQPGKGAHKDSKEKKLLDNKRKGS